MKGKCARCGSDDLTHLFIEARYEVTHNIEKAKQVAIWEYFECGGCSVVIVERKDSDLGENNS